MSEEKKEGCCGGGQSGCCGVKKIIVAIAFAALLFTCGYVIGKGGCPMGSGAKTCPIVNQK